MPKNIIICCDGTGNEINTHLSNVLKAYRIFEKNDQQVTFYDPGVGTLSNNTIWSRSKQWFKKTFSKATGFGLDENVMEAYSFLIDYYESGDQIYLFGFSRGAYTVRVLAGFLYLIGLLKPEQKNLIEYAYSSYKESSIHHDLSIGWRFNNVIIQKEKVPIRFIGVWDTVNSVLIPTPYFIIGIKQQSLPYTFTNPGVRCFRQALAVDERRCMFRAHHWRKVQDYKPDPFSKEEAQPQDIKQVWFAGCHSDIGGGYPEEESGLAKYPLKWMLDEAEACGIVLNKRKYERYVMGKDDPRSSRKYAKPDVEAQIHNSMTFAWKLIEWLPRSLKKREWKKRWSFGFFYFPFSEPRFIENDALVHPSVKERKEKVKKYKPVNLPENPEWLEG